MLKDLQADLARYRGGGASWVGIAGNPAVWSLVWYRIGHWIYKENSPRLLRWPLKLVHVVVSKLMEAFMQMRLDPSAEIGGGLYIGHSGGVHFHPDVVIGMNCDVAHHVTIGASAMGRKGVPKLGDNVYVGTGATIVGDIQIGDGARIAANTLVMTNVPPGATVMGVPGRVVMHAAPAKISGAQP